MLACWFVLFFGFIGFDCRIFPGTLQDELWRSAVRYLANDTKGELFGKAESCICVPVCAIQVICYSFFYCCCGCCCCCHCCCLPCRLTCQFKVHLAHISLATCWFEPPGLGKIFFAPGTCHWARGAEDHKIPVSWYCNFSAHDAGLRANQLEWLDVEWWNLGPSQDLIQCIIQYWTSRSDIAPQHAMRLFKKRLCQFKSAQSWQSRKASKS